MNDSGRIVGFLVFFFFFSSMISVMKQGNGRRMGSLIRVLIIWNISSSHWLPPDSRQKAYYCVMEAGGSVLLLLTSTDARGVSSSSLAEPALMCRT